MVYDLSQAMESCAAGPSAAPSAEELQKTDEKYKQGVKCIQASFIFQLAIVKLIVEGILKLFHIHNPISSNIGPSAGASRGAAWRSPARED